MTVFSYIPQFLTVSTNDLDPSESARVVVVNETPCVLVTEYTACSSDPVLSQENSPPINHCTCNEAFYNLWSACHKSASKPSFGDWSTRCQDLSVVVTYNNNPPDKRFSVSGRRYPRNVGPNVLASDTTNHGWTPVQILVPIVVGLSLTAIFTVCFFLYRWKYEADVQNVPWSIRGPRGPRRFFGLFPNVRPVRRDSRATWSIDDYEEFDGRPAGQSEDRRGHVRLPSDNLELSTRTSRSTNSIRSLLPKRTPRSGPSLWKNPFKRQPISVVSIPPNPNFRLDDVESRFEPTTPTGRNASRLNLANGFGSHIKRIVRDEDRDRNRANDNDDDEVDENGVFLISRHPGADFSSEVGDSPTNAVHVIPPSSPDPHVGSFRTNTHPYQVHNGRPTKNNASSSSLQIITNGRRTPSPSRSLQPSGESHRSPASPSVNDLPREQLPRLELPRHPAESPVWPSRGDPTMLFPGPVRAAGYAVPATSPQHRRNVSS